MGTVIEFPRRDSSREMFRDTPARTNRRRYFGAEEARCRLLSGTLPARSVILGSLNFSGDDNPLFPPDTRICGSLVLYHCYKVTKVGDGLEVEGNADYIGTLRRLPRRHKVRGILTIMGTDIKGVPRGLVAEGGVIIDEAASPSLRDLATRMPCRWSSSTVEMDF